MRRCCAHDEKNKNETYYSTEASLAIVRRNSETASKHRPDESHSSDI